MLLHSKWNIIVKVGANFVICSASLQNFGPKYVERVKVFFHSCNFVTFSLAFFWGGAALADVVQFSFLIMFYCHCIKLYLFGLLL